MESKHACIVQLRLMYSIMLCCRNASSVALSLLIHSLTHPPPPSFFPSPPPLSLTLPLLSFSYRETGPRCPVDNTKVSNHQLFKDNFAKREVLSLNVRCSADDAGCKWQGELRDLEVCYSCNPAWFFQSCWHAVEYLY